MRVTLAAAAAFALFAPAAAAQITTQAPQPSPAVEDSLALPPFPEPSQEGARVSFSPKVYAPYLWSPTAGIGLGYGVEVKNLGFDQSSLLLTGVTSRRIGRYGVSYATRTPYEPGLSAMVGGTFETTGRRYYYGVGPFSDIDNRMGVEKQLYEGELRLGATLRPDGDRRVQAFGRYQFHKTRTAEDLDTGARGRLDLASEQNLSFALATDVGALTAGVEAIWDMRNDLYVPRYGFMAQAGVSYTDALQGADVSFVRTYAAGNYFLPLDWQNTTLHARAIVSSIDAVDGADPLPFFLMPVFDTDYGLGLATNRYYARDYFLASAELHKPVFITGALDIDALGGVTLYNVYDDILKQFHPVPSLSKNRVDDDRYPLQAAFGAGLRISSELLPGFVLHGQVGFGPEGFSFTTFNLVADLRAVRPILRGL